MGTGRAKGKKNRARPSSERRFPAATIAYYGPDDQRASKVVVGILATRTADVEPLEEWVADIGDVRNDPDIAREIGEFLKAHGVKSVIATDRIIGCPHQEGIDYPEGGKCPRCPFWATRDRWSGDVIQ